jgi:hypothetical protein
MYIGMYNLLWRSGPLILKEVRRIREYVTKALQPTLYRGHEKGLYEGIQEVASATSISYRSQEATSTSGSWPLQPPPFTKVTTPWKHPPLTEGWVYTDPRR